MARTDEERLSTCAHCKTPLKGFYEITRHENNEKIGWVRLCSIMCIINWAPKHGLRRVQSVLSNISGAFDRGRR